ncbi:hypothetical protein [Haloplanus aerogenes]|uniref:Uncharacterized protein n=1 Tax=Haloplanus aerogenes TaxID=660522 RepID=A0A3M0CX05_9EURY|nr:hypothetical protein [Haloplanus aerogenes]AZH23905.1 hypothetical protein DU502_00285 [Haloplanus aerogenes]RMB13335.1 hypothetical protein ATH50_2668 [Haloplanus aerogenes]
MLTDAISIVCEEAAGTLCGLPPGTVTAAKAMGAGVAAGSAGSTVEQNTAQLTDEEKQIVATAVHNVAVTAARDNPTWSEAQAKEFGMSLVLAASQIYSGDALKQAMLDAVSANRQRHHRLIVNVAKSLR